MTEIIDNVPEKTQKMRVAGPIKRRKGEKRRDATETPITRVRATKPSPRRGGRRKRITLRPVGHVLPGTAKVCGRCPILRGEAAKARKADFSRAKKQAARRRARETYISSVREVLTYDRVGSWIIVCALAAAIMWFFWWAALIIMGVHLFLIDRTWEDMT